MEAAEAVGGRRREEERRRERGHGSASLLLSGKEMGYGLEKVKTFFPFNKEENKKSYFWGKKEENSTLELFSLYSNEGIFFLQQYIL